MHVTSPKGARRVRAVLVGSLVALLVAACGSTAASPSTGPVSGACPTNNAPAQIDGWGTTVKATGIIPQIISTQLVCGKNRLLFGFTTLTKDSSGQQVAVSAGAPDRTAKVAFYDLGKDPKTPVTTVDGTFVWAIEGKTGIYTSSVTFPEAGDWGAEFTTAAGGAAPETIRFRFQVQAEGIMPGLGEQAPSVKTPTAGDVGGDLKQISTDPAPNPRFYQLSEDQAIAQHKPFVLVFATPAFCTSQICGPTLDKVKALAADYPDLTFINVEPYKMQFTAGRLQPVLDAQGQLQVNDASDAFKILSEPWIFVVDGQGRITGSFETLAGPDELKSAIAAATKG
jgi:hypothetical protein